MGVGRGQADGQPEAPQWSAPKDKIFEIVNNSRQIAPTFFNLSIGGNVKGVEYCDSFLFYLLRLCVLIQYSTC